MKRKPLYLSKQTTKQLKTIIMKTHRGQVVTSQRMNKYDLMNILLDYDIHYPMSTPIEVLKERLIKEGI